MEQIASYTSSLLNVLATNLGVTPSEAVTKSRTIADSYATMNRAYGDELKAALEITKAFKINAQVLSNVLMYVNDVKNGIGSISRDHTKPLSRETVKALGDNSLEAKANVVDLDSRRKAKITTTAPTYFDDRSSERAYAAAGGSTLYAFPGQLFSRRAWANGWRAVRNRFPNVRANVNRHPRTVVYSSIAALGIAGLLSYAAVNGIKPNQAPRAVLSGYSHVPAEARNSYSKLFGGKTPTQVASPQPSKPATTTASSTQASPVKPAPQATVAAGQQKFDLDKEIAIWAQTYQSTVSGQPSVAQAPGASVAPATPIAAKVPTLEELAREVDMLKKKFETGYVTRADYDKGIADLRQLVTTVQAGAGAKAPVPVVAVQSKVEYVPAAAQKASQYVVKFGELLWNVVKNHYGLEGNDAIAKQVNVVVNANPQYPHLRTDNRAVVPLDYAMRSNLDIVKILPDRGLAVVAKADGIMGDVLRTGDKLILPGLEEAVKRPVAELPPRAEAPAKLSLRVQFKPEHLTEAVPVGVVVTKPSLYKGKIPFVPEHLTEPNFTR